MGGYLVDGDYSTSGRVKSCKVSPEVWLSTLGGMPDPRQPLMTLLDLRIIPFSHHQAAFFPWEF